MQEVVAVGGGGVGWGGGDTVSDSFYLKQEYP